MRQELAHYLVKQTGVPFTGVAVVESVHPTGTPATFIPTDTGFVRVDWESTPAQSDVDLVVSAIQNADPSGTTAGERESGTFKQSLSDFGEIPNYSRWTPQEAHDNITNAVFGGKTFVEINSEINALPNNTAGMKVGLKMLALAIVDLRGVLAMAGKMIMLLRNVAIRKG